MSAVTTPTITLPKDASGIASAPSNASAAKPAAHALTPAAAKNGATAVAARSLTPKVESSSKKTATSTPLFALSKPLSPMPDTAPFTGKDIGMGLASFNIGGTQFVFDKESGTLIPCFS